MRVSQGCLTKAKPDTSDFPALAAIQPQLVLAFGSVAALHAGADSLVDGAQTAAEAALALQSTNGECLALLVSCEGRKLVMGCRVDEEVEAVVQVFGQATTVAGFYSYGEISPFGSSLGCKLHNQTMAIAYISEAG